MKVTGEKGLGSMIKILLQICFYGGIFILVTMPFVLNIFGVNLNASFIVIYPNGIVILMIVYNFIKLFDSLKKEKPFCDNNVKILKQTSIISIVEGVLWLFDLSYQIILAHSFDVVINVFLIFLSILFFGVSIALYILSELLREGTHYKKENELTI